MASPEMGDMAGSRGAPNAAATTKAGGSSNNTSSTGSTNYSQTNVQVKGVDEADIVKNDDKYIYVLRAPYFLIYKAWPAKDLNLLGKYKVDGTPQEMFVYKDKVVVFSTDSKPSSDNSATRFSIQYSTIISVLDISSSKSPKEIRRATIEGNYKTSRRVNGMVRVVIHSKLKDPVGAKLSNSVNSLDPWTQRVSRMVSAQEFNRALGSTKLADWLPAFKERITKNGATQDINTSASDCSNYHYPSADAGLGLLTVWSLDLDQPERQIKPVTMVSEYYHTYSSAKSLYVATRPLWSENNVYSHLHKFATESKEPAKYIASGSFQGSILNQFAMDEYKDSFRVATTTSFNGTSENKILVFQQQGNNLKQVGSTKGLAKGERIYAVRYMGDRGYIVTFRQVDPLFTLDLSKPTAPKAIGELKIPGFSTYLHPLDKNHLLSIGVDGNQWGTTGGLQLALFDVSDFKNPIQKHKLSVSSDQWQNDEALYNHKAFQYYAHKKVLAIPLTGYSGASYKYSSWTSRLMLYNVDIDKGITPKDQVDHSDLIQRTKQDKDENRNGYYNYNNELLMRRAVFMDNTVFSISMVGIKANDLDQLEKVISDAVYPE